MTSAQPVIEAAGRMRQAGDIGEIANGEGIDADPGYGTETERSA